MRFRNIQTGEIRERSEDHPEYPRLARQNHRWEQLPTEVDVDADPEDDRVDFVVEIEDE